MKGKTKWMAKWALEQGYTHITNGAGTISLKSIGNVIKGVWEYGENGCLVKHGEKWFTLFAEREIFQLYPPSDEKGEK